MPLPMAKPCGVGHPARQCPVGKHQGTAKNTTGLRCELHRALTGLGWLTVLQVEPPRLAVVCAWHSRATKRSGSLCSKSNVYNKTSVEY